MSASASASNRSTPSRHLKTRQALTPRSSAWSRQGSKNNRSHESQLLCISTRGSSSCRSQGHNRTGQGDHLVVSRPKWSLMALTVPSTTWLSLTHQHKVLPLAQLRLARRSQPATHPKLLERKGQRYVDQCPSYHQGLVHQLSMRQAVETTSSALSRSSVSATPVTTRLTCPWEDQQARA